VMIAVHGLRGYRVGSWAQAQGEKGSVAETADLGVAPRNSRVVVLLSLSETADFSRLGHAIG
jgi:hypothetical protein